MDRQPFDRPDHAEHELKGDERVAHKTEGCEPNPSRTTAQEGEGLTTEVGAGWLAWPLIRGALSVRYRRDAETILLQMETSYRNIINIL